MRGNAINMVSNQIVSSSSVYVKVSCILIPGKDD